jgi:hypothetical protein
MNLDCADKNRLTIRNTLKLLRWLAKTCTMINCVDHHRAGSRKPASASKYAISTTGRDIAFLSGTYQIDDLMSLDHLRPVFSPTRKKHTGI